MAESFTPPERVASAARRGLRLREKVKAGTDVGVARARDLSNRRPVSLETIGRMVSFFARHGAQKPANIGTDAEPTPWLVAWLLWGGDPGRDWSAGVWRRKGSEGEAARLGLSRRGPALALSREAPAAPDGMPLHNPDGLHVGRAFRVLTAGETVRDGSTGEALGNFPVEVLAEFVKVFYARCSAGEGAPRIDHNHGPSRGMDPTILGAVLACYVADDGERGPGLYVIPGYTDHGRDFVAKHATPDGGSVLSNSPEFAVGPVYARGGGDPAEVGDLLGGAELLGVALTGSPQQSEAIIDAVRLSRDGQSTAYAAGEVSGMDPEERFAALEATLAEHAAQMGKMAEMLGAIKERLEGGDEAAVEMAVEGAAAAVEEITAEAVEEVRAAAEEQMSQLSAEEVAEVEEEMPQAMALAIRRGIGNRKAKVAAWSKRAELARAKLAGRELRTLKQQFSAMQARATEAECDAFVMELRAFGLPPGDEPAIRRYFTAKRNDPKTWAAMHGEDCPLDREVKAIKANARRTVPMGRAGVTVQPGDSKITRADVRAWARDNDIDYDKDPARAGAAWAKATGRNTQEIAR